MDCKKNRIGETGLDLSIPEQGGMKHCTQLGKILHNLINYRLFIVENLLLHLLLARLHV